MDLYGSKIPDRDKYQEMKEWDPEARKSKFTLGSYVSYGVGGLLLIIGIVVGPERKVAAGETEKVS